MINDLINRMRFHGYICENGVFYKPYDKAIMTLEQAKAWIEGLQNDNDE